MALGNELPNKTEGSALWADLSGFTPLAETLARKLGARHGAEELALNLNRFYDALIAPVDHYGGSVVGFSGDAISCWFNADDGRRAVAAAQAMQVAMLSFASLQLPTGEIVSVGIKVAISSGLVRRLQVGNPAIQYLDTLAGATLERLAAIGDLAQMGELVVDEHTQAQLHDILQISKWRTSKETGHRAAVLRSLDSPVEASPQVLRLPALTEEQVRPWLLPAVFARLKGGQGEFLTELRPAVALFMRFEGLDYEADEQVGEKLDAIVRQVQHVLLKYDGTLLQLTIGDKGSYLYAAFGAPVAHEDDAMRAVAAALELSALPGKVGGIDSVSIGLSRGTMRTGAYGGITRRTYGVLGDDVNLAARLMTHAAPGQVLASKAVWQATASDFSWQTQPILKVKGKRATVAPALLHGRLTLEILDLPQDATVLPMIGRQAELALVEEKLNLARHGHGQIVGITGEAGMGKSRLLAEILRRAGNLTYYLGECESYGTQSPFLVWQSIWRTFFDLDPDGSLVDHIQTLEKELTHVNSDFLERLPLLGPALNLSIPNNSLTDGMDVRTRKLLREASLVDCLRTRASERPLVLVLDDVHWIDPLSRDLLEQIAQAVKELPVLVLLAYRPPAEANAAAFLPGLAKLSHMTEVHLAQLGYVEIEQFIATRLAHFELNGGVPPHLVERMLARAQGNPFYIEELLNYLHGHGLDPRQEAAWQQADLPDSLHSLILSRIDQLSEQQQITIKAASIIGRLFRAAWLYGYYPSLGSPPQVSADLEMLSRRELIAQEVPEPQLAYLFKHVITQEVAYESLAYATRANLHEQFAHYLELAAGEDTGPFLDLLAYHYERSDNLPKKREYLRKAGEAAQNAFANEVALSYLGKALTLAPEIDYAERFDLLFVRKQIYDLLGETEAHKQDMNSLAVLAENLDDHRRAMAALSRSKYALEISDYQAALVAAQQAVEFAHLAGADEYEARGYLQWGSALEGQSNFAEARTYYEQALAHAQTNELTNWLRAILLGLGSIEIHQGNFSNAQTYLERALHVQGEGISHRLNEISVLYTLGELAYMGGDFARAQPYYEQALAASRVMGKRRFEAIILVRICSLLTEQRGDYAKAKKYSEDALLLLQETNDRYGNMLALMSLSFVDLAQNNYVTAKTDVERALSITQEIGDKYHEADCLGQLGSIVSELGEYTSAVEYYHAALSILREIGERDLFGQITTNLGYVFYHLDKYETAQENSQLALSIVEETKNKLAQNHAVTLQAHTLSESGDMNRATDFYRHALDLATGLRLPHLVKRAQTGLARVALAQGNLAQAQAPMNEILNYLETTSLCSIDEIFWIYLSCYRILQANADPRARATLNAAYKLLQEIAARIDDEALRASFLQNVRSNREIIEAWESLAAD